MGRRESSTSQGDRFQKTLKHPAPWSRNPTSRTRKQVPVVQVAWSVVLGYGSLRGQRHQHRASQGYCGASAASWKLFRFCKAAVPFWDDVSKRHRAQARHLLIPLSSHGSSLSLPSPPSSLFLSAPSTPGFTFATICGMHTVFCVSPRTWCYLFHYVSDSFPLGLFWSSVGIVGWIPNLL